MTHSYEHGNIYNTVVHKRTQVCTCLMTDRKETCMHVCTVFAIIGLHGCLWDEEFNTLPVLKGYV